MDLSYNILVSSIEDAVQMGIPMVSLSGGEPLMHARFSDICSFLRDRPLTINLNTNGTLINRSNAKLIKETFDFVRVSLDGPSNTNDGLTRVKKSFDKTMKGISLLASAKGKAKVGINFVVTEKNLESFNVFIREIREKVDFVSLLPEFSFEQDSKKILNKNARDLSKNYFAYGDTIGNTREFLESNKLMMAHECDAGRLYYAVFFDASVTCCPFPKAGALRENDNDYVLGNLRHMKLSEIIRRKDRCKPLCTGCYATCTTEVSRIFRMSPTQMLFKIPKLAKTFRLSIRSS